MVVCVKLSKESESSLLGKVKEILNWFYNCLRYAKPIHRLQSVICTVRGSESVQHFDEAVPLHPKGGKWGGKWGRRLTYACQKIWAKKDSHHMWASVEQKVEFPCTWIQMRCLSDFGWMLTRWVLSCCFLFGNLLDSSYSWQISPPGQKTNSFRGVSWSRREFRWGEATFLHDDTLWFKPVG